MKETERMYLCLSQERIIQFQVSYRNILAYESVSTLTLMTDPVVTYEFSEIKLKTETLPCRSLGTANCCLHFDNLASIVWNEPGLPT